MNADLQTQENISIATDVVAPMFALLDLDLMYVGGGTETGVLF